MRIVIPEVFIRFSSAKKQAVHGAVLITSIIGVKHLEKYHRVVPLQHVEKSMNSRQGWEVLKQCKNFGHFSCEYFSHHL